MTSMRGSPSGSSNSGARPLRASARACSSSLARRSRVCTAAARTPPTRSPIRRPVRSSAPPAIRKKKTRCAPGVREQRRGGPVQGLAHHSAPLHHRVDAPEVAGIPAAWSEPERAGREAERQAERDRDRAGPQARGRLDPLTGGERDARADHEQRQQVGDSADQEPEHVRHALADRAAAGPHQEAEQQPACDEGEPDRVDGGLVQIGQTHAREVRAARTRPRLRDFATRA